MRDDQRAHLVQRWVILTDDEGREHLEARWVVESPVNHGIPLVAA